MPENIYYLDGAKNIYLGGEGLFHTRITGPGKVYLQSMPIMQIAQEDSPYLSLGDSDGGIKINIGD